jgi:hypothetical protein
MAVRILTLPCSGARLTLSQQLASMVFSNARMAFWTLWFFQKGSLARVDEKKTKEETKRRQRWLSCLAVSMSRGGWMSSNKSGRRRD